MKRFSAVALACAFALAAAACGPNDKVTTRSVRAKLLDASQQTRGVHAFTQDGVVILSGVVDSPAAKAQAVRLARETPGVKDVIDEIQVDAPAATTGQK